MSDYKMVPVVATDDMFKVGQDMCDKPTVYAENVYAAMLAAAPPFVVTDEMVEKSARVVAERAGVDFDSVDDIVRQVLMDTQRAAIEAVLGGGV